ncbi:hypothetical protein LC55x_4047 [Lysobacter capsici]|uniref:hypothetical protein n=1 Tax=Lysobacter capsici TaxID=435897 RepID=UPI0007165DAC|nr:hypothetical protein [Lysobacter capsici]ALN87298.1 hypothetical protein LC55x_4047 [Lysobacter capsici]
MKRIVTREDAIAWFRDQGFLHWPGAERPGHIGIAGEAERVVLGAGRRGPDDPGTVLDLHHDTFLIAQDGARWQVVGSAAQSEAQDFDSLHEAALEVGRRINALRNERGRGHDALADALSQLRMRGFAVRSDRHWSSSRILLFDPAQGDLVDADELKRGRAAFSLSFDPRCGDWQVLGYREPHRGEDTRFEALQDAIAWLAVRLDGVAAGDAGGVLR